MAIEDIMKILHISDLHFGTREDALRWYSQLSDDLKQGLSCNKLNAMIISGDVANFADDVEYRAAKEFVERICDEFRMNRSDVIIVPGNHDLNWELSKAGYTEEKKETTHGLKEGTFIEENDSVILLRNDEAYKKRFSPFIKFYSDVKRVPYPFENRDQGIIYHLKDYNILILGLNSAWQVDHHFESRVSICPDAVSTALDAIRQNHNYEKCLKFAVWHHPLNSPFDDRITDHGFMERLAQHGFRLCFHGHLHKSTRDLFRYDHSSSGRKIEIVGAGTFGAPTKEWFPGYPLQYNLLSVSHDQINVETRCRTEINGAWKPDARWCIGPGEDPRPRYTIDLSTTKESQPEQTAHIDPRLAPKHLPNRNHNELRKTAISAAETLLSNAKSRWNYPDSTFELHLDYIKPEQTRNSSTIYKISQNDLIEKFKGGANLLLTGKAGIGKTTTLIALSEEFLYDPYLPLPVYVDASIWASTGKTILEYIANLPVFIDIDFSVKHLTALNERGKLLIVLNGWNEISLTKKEDARERLQEFLFGTNATRMVVSTRFINDIFEIPNPITVNVRGFGWHEQQSFIKKHLPEDGADELLNKLRANTKLRSVTKNPMVLSGAVSLQKQGKIVTDILYDLYAGIVQEYEQEASRIRAFDGYPIRQCHREYLCSLAEQMNDSSQVNISEKEARRIITEKSHDMVKEGFLSQVPESEDVIERLCDYHLLHKSENSELQFSHQRFQEFFSACAFIQRFDSALTDLQAQRAVKTQILNSPFWGDAIELVAQKYSTNNDFNPNASLLIDLSKSVDLYCSSELAGIIGTGNCNKDTWQELKSDILYMHQYPDPEAKQYALQCLAATRSTDFESILWQLLENESQQVRLEGYRLAGGLTAHQIGLTSVQRMSKWPEKQRIEAVWELSHRSENFEFIKLVSEQDDAGSVRAEALQALDYSNLFSELAIRLWWEESDEVKCLKPALSVALDHWKPEDSELTKELMRLVEKSEDERVKTQIGLRLLENSDGIGIEVARSALSEQYEKKTQYKNVDLTETLVTFLKSKDPVFIKKLAITLFKQKYKVDNWIHKEILSFPDSTRDELILFALERLSDNRHGNVDLDVAFGASKKLTESLVDEGLSLVLTDWRDRKITEEQRNRYYVIRDILTRVPDTFFIQVILDKADKCDYSQVAWLADILNQRAKDDESGHVEMDKESSWRPTVQDLDAIIAAFKGKTDNRAVSSCKLEANLASIASKTDANLYLDFILWCVRRHIQAYDQYEMILKQWLRKRTDSQRPSNPPYHNWFTSALTRCGFTAVPKLLEMINIPGASHIVPDGLVSILVEPWIQKINKGVFMRNPYLSNHHKRRTADRIFKQPDDCYQSETDEVAEMLSKQIKEIIVPDNVDSAGVDESKRPPEAHHYWEMCEKLCRVPSQKSIPTINIALKRNDAQLYPYLTIAQNVINQGGNYSA